MLQYLYRMGINSDPKYKYGGKPMTNETTNEQNELISLPPTTLRILIEFYRIRKKDGGEITMPVEEIASRLNMAKSTFRQHLKTLETGGFIASKQNFDALGRHLPKTYTVNLAFGDFINTLFGIQGFKQQNQKNNQPNRNNRHQNNHQHRKSNNQFPHKK